MLVKVCISVTVLSWPLLASVERESEVMTVRTVVTASVLVVRPRLSVVIMVIVGVVEGVLEKH
jgi:hypothetical protein